MYLTQGAVTNGMAVLVQVAMMYNLIILPLRFVYQMPGYVWTEYADYLTDRVLVFDLLMMIFDIFIEDGEPRTRKALQQILTQEWFYVIMHIMACAEASAVYLMPFFPLHVSLRAIKMLLLPHFLVSIVPLSDINKRILTAAGGLVRISML